MSRPTPLYPEQAHAREKEVFEREKKVFERENKVFERAERLGPVLGMLPQNWVGALQGAMGVVGVVWCVYSGCSGTRKHSSLSLRCHSHIDAVCACMRALTHPDLLFIVRLSHYPPYLRFCAHLCPTHPTYLLLCA